MRIVQVLKLCFVLLVVIGAIACSPPAVTSPSAAPSTFPSSSATLPRATPSTAPETGVTTPSETWIETVQTSLAQTLAISPNQIQLKEVTPSEWNDACLGLPQPDELCAQVITPGYQATFSTPQGDYFIHSDRTGQSVRIAEPSP
ncbi:MAG: hypothetical protein SFY66_24195 [Oculatellaceae cyanobacterium bins.114]|nr:hypothetical protein [Oculatellaceae cyanobacterium bins.114]